MRCARGTFPGFLPPFLSIRVPPADAFFRGFAATQADVTKYLEVFRTSEMEFGISQEELQTMTGKSAAVVADLAAAMSSPTSKGLYVSCPINSSHHCFTLSVL